MIKNKCITSPKANKKTASQNAELVSIILLCDSPGYRMKSYGPTSLVTIANKKLIDIQIEAIKQSFTNFDAETDFTRQDGAFLESCKAPEVISSSCS